MDHTECADCAGSGEICTGCWAPTDWCDCEHSETPSRTVTCRTCSEEHPELPLVAAA